MRKVSSKDVKDTQNEKASAANLDVKLPVWISIWTAEVILYY